MLQPSNETLFDLVCVLECSTCCIETFQDESRLIFHPRHPVFVVLWSPCCLNVVGLVILVFPPANTHVRERKLFSLAVCCSDAYYRRTQMAFTLRCEMLGRYERPFQELPMWLNLVHERRLERSGMDLEQSVFLSLRVQIHNISYSRQLHTLPPSE